MAEIFDGNRFASAIERRIIRRLDTIGKPSLNLHSIFIGDNTGSEIYIRMKEKSLRRIGGTLTVHRFGAGEELESVVERIKELNTDKDVHGIMIELPLPDGWSMPELVGEIIPEKDVDAQNPVNVGRILQGKPLFVPPTPMAVMMILEESGIKLESSDVCVINHSASIGRPLSMLLLNDNATVHVCHVFTRDASKYSREADVIIVAAGVPGLIGPDMIKEGSVVIDVGMNRVGGKVVGDVDFDEVADKAGFITPVPGGVGPVTRYTLLLNLLKAYEMMA